MFLQRMLLLPLAILMLTACGCSKKSIKAETLPKAARESATGARDNPGQDADALAHRIFVPVYFDYDQSELRTDALQVLEKIGPFLREYQSFQIMAEGNCDERGTNEYNVGLGENRSRAVKEWLVAYGIPENRIEMTSYGKERLAFSDCAEESCHQKNRRVEWKIIAQ